MYLSNDILVNCIQKGLRSNWISDSAKNIAKNQKELTIRKRNWINSFNSSLSIPIPIPIPFIQFLFNSNSWNWNWNWYQFQFQFRNWPQPWPFLETSSPGVHFTDNFRSLFEIYWRTCSRHHNNTTVICIKYTKRCLHLFSLRMVICKINPLSSSSWFPGARFY